MQPSDALTTLRQCDEHIFSWNTRNMFKWNPGKTEVLHFTSRFMKQPSFGDSITFAGTEIIITKKAGNQRRFPHLNFQLTIKKHYSDIIKPIDRYLVCKHVKKRVVLSSHNVLLYNFSGIPKKIFTFGRLAPGRQ